VNRLVICNHDELELAVVRRLATEVGFEVVESADNAIELLRLAQVHRPDAAVVRNELSGIMGLEVVEDLVRLEPPVEVILLDIDPSLEQRGLDAGAFAVIPRRDIDALQAALGALREWLAAAERRTGGDRRSGDERRRMQDWTQVFAERRGGDDRRMTPRRKADRQRAAHLRDVSQSGAV
jgi:DNA-binding NarL/FixJ family response regulator